MKNLKPFILGIHETDQTMLNLVGGKCAHLGELTRIKGINVPDGFCLSTVAFRKIILENPIICQELDELAKLTLDQRPRLGELSRAIRQLIEDLVLPHELMEAVDHALSRHEASQPYAVRSSATAEDLPTASFAGQQDTYLNIIGREAVVQHIKRCWASLYSERAIVYRLQNEIDHRHVLMAVVIQTMIFSQAAGVMFTADPVSSHRKVLSIDASFGLGEAVVAGLVNADHYKVREGRLLLKKISCKSIEIHASVAGGTRKQAIESERQTRPALTDEQLLQLEAMGRAIEKHFGHPQDIEWCWALDQFHIVQSRPITTLYPIPEAADQRNRVYISVGHQQMMTDAMKPLGLSFFLLTTPAPMRVAGARLFVDVTQHLASPASRAALMDALGRSDPLMKDALMTIMERGDFIAEAPVEQSSHGAGPRAASPPDLSSQLENNPNLVSDLKNFHEASIEKLKADIRRKEGLELLDFIRDNISQLKTILFDPQSLLVIRAAMEASAWLNEKLYEWLGEKNAADILVQSLPHNVTTDMGFALMDVADVIRPYPDVIRYLQQPRAENILDGLTALEGGQESRQAIQNFLDHYGMRCRGEIDLTQTRWSENPILLVPMILSNIKNFKPKASAQKFAQGLQKALEKRQDVLDRLQALPDGEQKAQDAKRRIDLLRHCMAYREFPKYGMVTRTFLYKQALLQAAEKLQLAGVIREKEDIYYLSLDELRKVLQDRHLDQAIIYQRKEAQRAYERLKPPRVLTSDGEIIFGAYRREPVAADRILGLAVSSGMVTGRARVLMKMEDAELDAGDILVTPFTDPSWTPLFVTIKGLVTEVGGLMTHGAVIARELGLAAVVGVEDATQRIRDGQTIRVNGTEGYVELL